MRCPKCGASGYSRKTKKPKWRCRRCSVEWNDPTELESEEAFPVRCRQCGITDSKWFTKVYTTEPAWRCESCGFRANYSAGYQPTPIQTNSSDPAELIPVLFIVLLFLCVIIGIVLYQLDECVRPFCSKY